MPMTTRRQIHVASVCAVLALTVCALVFRLHKQPDAASIPLPSETGVQVGDLTDGTPADVASEPAVVAETPTAVKLVPVAMVPPPMREAEDATAKVETMPRAEDYEAVQFTKTSAATLRVLADDPAANTVLRLSARLSLSLLAE